MHIHFDPSDACIHAYTYICTHMGQNDTELNQG